MALQASGIVLLGAALLAVDPAVRLDLIDDRWIHPEALAGVARFMSTWINQRSKV